MKTRLGAALGIVFFLLTLSPMAYGLDKQRSCHSGDVAGEASGFDVSGTMLVGVALYNPSYAARPDNTGRALGRLAPHADIDLIGERLSIPIDVNVFTDREQHGLALLRPSEVDVLTGLTTTWPLGRPSALELGVRGERDMPADRKGLVQAYGDTRAKLLFDLLPVWPQLTPALRGGTITGNLTLGWFAYNPSYAARPDLTGLALFRYGSHVEVSVWNGHAAFALDAVSFTDRRQSAFVPSEIDLTPELIAREGNFEVHVAYERDMPVDRGGLVQQLLLLHGVWSFDWSANSRSALHHEQVKSPR
jgi:hypothetical protein